MKKLYLFLLLSFSAYPQEYKFYSAIGDFTDASSFYVNSAGYIYITDEGTDEVYKLDTLGSKKREAGGYGWGDDNFDNPSDVFATALNVYIADYNNHRIRSYDKDLNFISSLFTRENENRDEQFGFPTSCAVSNQGDLYVLDSENKRIVKYDLFGNFIQQFGSFDAGVYQFDNPTKIAISSNNNIFVIDGNYLIIFDQFGNGLQRIETEFNLSNVEIIFNNITINTDKTVLSANLNSPDISFTKINFSGFELSENIAGSLIFKNTLFLLTRRQILMFKKIE